jgi:hypothetical protein
MNRTRRLLWLLLLTTAGCAGASWTADRAALPVTVAVLPFGGDADPRLRALCRTLLGNAMRARGFDVLEEEHIDRLLAEHGWLQDEDRFQPSAVPVDAACRALAVDAVVVGRDFGESSLDLLLLRRHAFSGEVRWLRSDGSTALAIAHTAAENGGFLLRSGQVLNELRARGQHGTPAASAALVDAFVDDITAALPPPPHLAMATAPAAVLATDVAIGDHGGQRRVTVTGKVPAGSRVWLDIGSPAGGDRATSIPACERDGDYAGACDVPADGPQRVRVRVRDGHGRTASSEVKS